MLRIAFTAPDDGAHPHRLRILAIGAHPDDIEIGAGGTLLRLKEAGLVQSMHWLVLSGDAVRAAEARESAAAFFKGIPDSELTLHSFRDSYFPYEGAAVKDAVHESRAVYDPDLVLAPRRDDLHQDHRLVAELTWNIFRDHTILEYEIPKYDGDLNVANIYSELPEDLCRRKIDLLLRSYPSQRSRQWFTEDTFWALLRLRGVEISARTRFAEAFVARKLRL